MTILLTFIITIGADSRNSLQLAIRHKAKAGFAGWGSLLSHGLHSKYLGYFEIVYLHEIFYFEIVCLRNEWFIVKAAHEIGTVHSTFCFLSHGISH